MRQFARLRTVNARKPEGLHRRVIHIPECHQDESSCRHKSRKHDGSEKTNWYYGKAKPILPENCAVGMSSCHSDNEVRLGKRDIEHPIQRLSAVHKMDLFLEYLMTHDPAESEGQQRRKDK